MRHLFPIFGLALLLAVSLTCQSGHADPGQPFELENHVPATSLGFVALEDVGLWQERFEKTAMAGLFAEPDMQAFLKPILDSLQEMVEQRAGPLREIPPPMMELLEKLQGLRGQLAVAVLDVDMDRGQPSLVASLDFGSNADDFRTFLGRFTQEIDPEGQNIRTIQKDGRLFWQLTARGAPPLAATLYGGAFVLSTDMATLEMTVSGAIANPLGAQAGFKHVHAQAGGDDLAAFVYANVPALVTKLTDGPMSDREMRMANAMGLDTVKAAGYGLAFSGDGFRDSLIVHAPGADHGLVPLVELKPYAGKALHLIPSNAFYYEEGNGNLDTMLGNMRTLMAAIEPGMIAEVDQGLAHIGDVLGVDLEKDILGGLAGPVATYLSLPETGGLFPEFAYFLQAKDPGTFEASMDQLVKGIAGIMTEEGAAIASTREIAFRDHTLHLLELQGTRRRQTIPFTPTWTRIGDWFAITLVPHTMKEIVLRATEGSSSDGGLASQEDFREIMDARPAAAGGLAYVDLQAMLTMLYDTGVPLLQAALKPNMLPRGAPPLDWAMLPPTRVVRPYMRSLGMYTTWDKDGMSIAIQGPIPMASLFVGAMAIGIPFMMRGKMMRRDNMERHVVTAEPDGEMGGVRPPPRPAGGMATAQRNMAEVQARNLARQVRRYMLQSGKMPASLAVLEDEDFLKAVPRDPWGSTFRMVVVDEAKKAFQLVSAGPDGSLGTGDDVVVDG